MAPSIDRAGLERLYQRYGTLVFRRARRLLGDEQLARDVCHDVFVQVLRHQPWDPPSPLGWLYTTTTRACLNVLRGSRRFRAALRARPQPPPAPPALPLGALLRDIPPLAGGGSLLRSRSHDLLARRAFPEVRLQRRGDGDGQLAGGQAGQRQLGRTRRGAGQ